jgi:hypothetical protein
MKTAQGIFDQLFGEELIAAAVVSFDSVCMVIGRHTGDNHTVAVLIAFSDLFAFGARLLCCL